MLRYVHKIFLLNQTLNCSIAITATRIKTIIGDILSNLKKILWVSIILPTPPAPTSPKITDALIQSSKIYKKYAVKFGRICGSAEVKTA